LRIIKVAWYMIAINSTTKYSAEIQQQPKKIKHNLVINTNLILKTSAFFIKDRCTLTQK
jgi:hypothetical protein